MLVSFGGQTITYDEIGNPINYLGNTLSWTGRTLDSIVKADGTQISYTYDLDGIRTKKVVNGVTTEYFVNGTTILAQKTGDNVIWYIYDSDGQILGFTYNDTPYYYIKNLQGDVVRVVNGMGGTVATYTYDPWGKITSSTGTMADINPIRYRGYYYDSETGLYYLNTRYYDPDTCRFINADDYVTTGQGVLSFNMFAYCLNNPVNFVDPMGDCAADAFTGIICDNSVIQELLTIKYDVPLYDQGGTKLCWAYCQVMIEDYQNKVKKSKAEADTRAKELAMELNGASNWNRGNWPTNCTGYNANGVPKNQKKNSILSLYMMLKRNGPVYAYYAKNDNSGAHLVVVTGVDLYHGIVYTNNPWGEYGQQTYGDFSNGFVGGLSDGTYPLNFCIPINFD